MKTLYSYIAAFVRAFFVALGFFGLDSVFVWFQYQWYTRVALPRPKLPVVAFANNSVLYDLHQWERDMCIAFPFRYWFTITLPRVFRIYVRNPITHLLKRAAQ